MGIILSKKMWLLTFRECGHHQITYFSLDRVSQGWKDF
jgi:hypothetical protein